MSNFFCNKLLPEQIHWIFIALLARYTNRIGNKYNNKPSSFYFEQCTWDVSKSIDDFFPLFFSSTFFSHFNCLVVERSNSLGKNLFAIKNKKWQKHIYRKKKRQTAEIVFVTNELPLKITISQYTLIKSESISNDREIYCCDAYLLVTKIFGSYCC